MPTNRFNRLQPDRTHGKHHAKRKAPCIVEAEMTATVLDPPDLKVILDGLAQVDPSVKNFARDYLRRELVSTLYRIEVALGPQQAVALAIELAGASLAFASDKATSNEERGQIADEIHSWADALMLRHPIGTA